jgi:hypothetical protein
VQLGNLSACADVPHVRDCAGSIDRCDAQAIRRHGDELNRNRCPERCSSRTSDPVAAFQTWTPSRPAVISRAPSALYAALNTVLLGMWNNR